jgi:hypothetical protein
MRSYQKLKLRLPASDIVVDAGELTLIKEHNEPQKYGVRLSKLREFKSVPSKTYMAKPEDAAKVVALLPKELLDVEVPEVWLLYIKPDENSLTSMLAPHKDIVRLCGINFYLETHGERTVYYSYASGGKLTEVGSFVAQDGECYVMDVDEPHAVELTPNYVRRMVSVSFVRTPYKEVIKYFDNCYA